MTSDNTKIPPSGESLNTVSDTLQSSQPPQPSSGSAHQLQIEDSNTGNIPIQQTPTLPTSNEKISEYKLPDKIPEGWLNDLKNAVKESKTKLIVTTILGSSLLTGFLGSIGNYFIENHKSTLEWNRVVAKSTLDTYTLLGNDIQDLESKVISARVLTLAAASDPSRINLALDQISALSNQIAIVQNRIKHQDIDNGKGTRELIEKWLNPVPAKIAAAQKNPTNRETLTDLANTLESIQNQGVNEIKNHINTMKQSLKENLS